jgi:regulator of nonsense transcripts 1
MVVQAQALVMVGDPKQLPPTVKCREAERLGLGLSMFDRLQAMGLPPLLLDVQYRMHPALCEFPSAQFYGGLLRSWPQPRDRPLPGGIAWPNPKVCWGLKCHPHALFIC